MFTSSHTARSHCCMPQVSASFPSNLPLSPLSFPLALFSPSNNWSSAISGYYPIETVCNHLKFWQVFFFARKAMPYTSPCRKSAMLPHFTPLPLPLSILLIGFTVALIGYRATLRPTCIIVLTWPT